MESRLMTTFADSKPPEEDEKTNDRHAYKLKRWPPLTLLHKDPVRIRMATMLSRRHIKISELASLTGLPKDEIYSFVHKLQMVGLIEMRQEAMNTPKPPPPQKTAADSVPPSAQPSAPAAASKPTSTFGKSLILSIRKRFGL